MAWFHDYNRDYNRTAGYNRNGAYYGDTPGQRSTSYGYDSGWGANRGARGPAYGGDRYGYDYEYTQRHPEQSPLYGRNADQAAQRWANRYGYDYTYQIQPRNAGGTTGRAQGVYSTTGRSLNRNQGGYNRGGYGGTTGGYSRYDTGYRW